MSASKTVTLRAHFDGEQIRLDEPFPLKTAACLAVTVWPEDNEDRERAEFLRLSLRGLQAAFAEDEPEYAVDLIKEPNPDYEGG